MCVCVCLVRRCSASVSCEIIESEVKGEASSSLEFSSGKLFPWGRAGWVQARLIFSRSLVWILSSQTFSFFYLLTSWSRMRMFVFVFFSYSSILQFGNINWFFLLFSGDKVQFSGRFKFLTRATANIHLSLSCDENFCQVKVVSKAIPVLLCVISFPRRTFWMILVQTLPRWNLPTLFRLFNDFFCFFALFSSGLYFFFNMLTAVIYNEFRGFFFVSFSKRIFKKLCSSLVLCATVM